MKLTNFITRTGLKAGKRRVNPPLMAFATLSSVAAGWDNRDRISPDLAPQAAAAASAAKPAAEFDARAYREVRAARLRIEINLLAKLDPAIAFGWSIGLVGPTHGPLRCEALQNPGSPGSPPGQPDPERRAAKKHSLAVSECMSRTLINSQVMDLNFFSTAPLQPQPSASSKRQKYHSPPDSALSDSPLSDCVSLLNTPELAMLMPTLLPPELILPQAVKATRPALQTRMKVSLRLSGCSSRLLG